MKNKFMTKALAVVLSASMALSLSSATALTANAAVAPKLNKKAVTVKEGKKKKVKLKAASYKAGWRISKVTVKKTAIAKAKKKKNNKVVVVTGVKKGATKIVLKLKNAKTGAAKKLKFKAKVTVDKPVIEEPTADVAKIESAKQVAFDKVEIKLSKEIETVPDTSVLRVYLDGQDYQLKAINFGTTKDVLVVEYDFAESSEVKAYVYEFGSTDETILTGKASITTGSYAVATIKAEDQTVTADVLDSVKFTLLNADGIDVTNATSNGATNLSNTTVEFEGAEVDSRTNTAAPKVRLANVGDTTVMTITYTANTAVDPVKVTITAVQPVSTEAVAMKTTCGKLTHAYIQQEELTSASVFEEDSASFTFWAKAKDDTAWGYKAVAYSTYEVSSSNEDYVTVSDAPSSSGKYDVITINGIKAGSANIIIKCVEVIGTTELPAVTYTIPVTVNTKNNDLVNITSSTTSVAISNAIDYDYKESVKLYATNSNDKDVDAEFVIDSITDSKGNPTSEIVASFDNRNTIQTSIDQAWASEKKGKELKIYAQAAKPGTYTIKYTTSGVNGNNSVEKNKSISVRVQDVLGSVSGNKADDIASLSIEMTVNNDLYIKNDDAKTASGVTIKVKKGSLFVGFAKFDDEGFVTVGDYDTKIDGEFLTRPASEIAKKAFNGVNKLFFEVKTPSSKYLIAESANDAAGLYCLGNEGVAEDVAGNTNMKPSFSIYESGCSIGDVFVYDSSARNEGIASAGKYTVYMYDKGVGVKDRKQLASKSFEVSYDIATPVIKYDASESATEFAIASVDLLTDDLQKYTFAYRVAGTKADEVAKGAAKATMNPYAKAKANMADFSSASWLVGTSNGFGKGDIVYAVSVPVDTGAGKLHYVVESTKTIAE